MTNISDHIDDTEAPTMLAENNGLILDAVFQVIPDLFFLMDPDGTILDYHCQRSSDLYVPAETFLGKKCRMFYQPRQPSSLKRTSLP